MPGVHNRINSDWEKLRRFAMQLFPAGYAERYLRHDVA
jgi:hypothetical protein